MTQPTEPKKKIGRKSKYTPETVEKICQAIHLGATYALACQYAGISHDTFHLWMNTKPEFYEQIKQAEGAGAITHLSKIKAAANNGVWQASAWILERRHPEMYGRQIQAQEHSGELTIKIVYDNEDSTPNETTPDAE